MVKNERGDSRAPSSQRVGIPELPDYIRWCHDAQGLTEKTTKEYGYKFARACRWFSSNFDKPIAQATKAELQSLIGAQKDSSRTRNQVRCALVQYFDSLVDRGIREDNPARLLKRLKERRGAPRPIPEEYIQPLLEKAWRYSLLFECALTLYLNTGLRQREVTNLKWSQIEGEYAYIKVKGGRKRTVYLAKPTLRVLERWRAKCPSKVWVFPSPRDNTKPISGTWIYHKIRDFGEEIGMPNLHTHRLRHTFATTMYRQTGDILLVREAMGHENIANTLIYTQVPSDRLQKSLQRVANGMARGRR